MMACHGCVCQSPCGQGLRFKYIRSVSLGTHNLRTQRVALAGWWVYGTWWHVNVCVNPAASRSPSSGSASVMASADTTNENICIEEGCKPATRRQEAFNTVHPVAPKRERFRLAPGSTGRTPATAAPGALGSQPVSKRQGPPGPAATVRHQVAVTRWGRNRRGCRVQGCAMQGTTGTGIRGRCLAVRVPATCAPQDTAWFSHALLLTRHA